MMTASILKTRGIAKGIVTQNEIELQDSENFRAIMNKALPENDEDEEDDEDPDNESTHEQD